MPPRKKIVIPKFKSAAADTDAMWTVLDSAIKQIFDKEQSKLSYEVLYRNAYNMVLHKQGETLYQNVRRVVATHLTAQAQAIARCNAGDFMGELQQQWKDFKLAITMVRDVCIYLDRTWVEQQAKTQPAGVAALPPVYEMGLDLFQRIVARDPQIKQRLLDTMLNYVEREREGQPIPRGLAKTISGMWHDISPRLYREDFEEPLLDASRLYYARLAQSLVGPGNEPQGAAKGGELRTCAAFFAEVEKRLADESARAQHYLHESTAPKLKAMVRPELTTRVPASL